MYDGPRLQEVGCLLEDEQSKDWSANIMGSSSFLHWAALTLGIMVFISALSRSTVSQGWGDDGLPWGGMSLLACAYRRWVDIWKMSGQKTGLLILNGFFFSLALGSSYS